MSRRRQEERQEKWEARRGTPRGGTLECYANPARDLLEPRSQSQDASSAVPCISIIPLPRVLRSVGSGMDDLNVFGSIVGNRKLLFLLIVSSSLLRDVHLAEFPSEEEEVSDGRGECCVAKMFGATGFPSFIFLRNRGQFLKGMHVPRCRPMYCEIKFLKAHAYNRFVVSFRSSR